MTEEQHTKWAAMRLISAGTVVGVQKLGGNEAQSSFSWTCVEDCGIDVLSMAFFKVLCRQYKLPRQCFELIWYRPEKAQGECTVTVTYILKPLLKEEDEYRKCYCFICHRPCADADDIGSPREDNCYRCGPCYLCNDCNVNINGRAVCYDCLAVEEIEIVPDQLRLQMLCPTKFRIASTSTPSTSTAS